MSGLFLRLRRIFLYMGLTLPLMPAQALLLAVRSPLSRRLPLVYHRLTSRILGFEVTVVGAPAGARPTLYVANHTSYLDIEILGGVIEGAFIAKSEVSRWPFISWLAKLQRTVFVDRRVHTTHRQRDAVVDRLKERGNLILFPEGTSADGTRVLPFKSALFAAVHGADLGFPVTVQPVSVAYVRLDGIPIGRFYRPFLAWYGDMDLGPHLWTALGLGVVEVTVQFHDPVDVDNFPTRKALAEHCWRVVQAGMATALAGRAQPMVPVPTVVAPPQAKRAVDAVADEISIGVP